jgi:hypothetical protein
MEKCIQNDDTVHLHNGAQTNNDTYPGILSTENATRRKKRIEWRQYKQQKLGAYPSQETTWIKCERKATHTSKLIKHIREKLKQN